MNKGGRNKPKVAPETHQHARQNNKHARRTNPKSHMRDA